MAGLPGNARKPLQQDKRRSESDHNYSTHESDVQKLGGGAVFVRISKINLSGIKVKIRFDLVNGARLE